MTWAYVQSLLRSLVAWLLKFHSIYLFVEVKVSLNSNNCKMFIFIFFLFRCVEKMPSLSNKQWEVNFSNRNILSGTFCRDILPGHFAGQILTFKWTVGWAIVRSSSQSWLRIPERPIKGYPNLAMLESAVRKIVKFE